MSSTETLPVPERTEAPNASVTAVLQRPQNRFELKYLVSHQMVPDLIGALGAYCYPDPHGGDTGYRVYSVYWDSPGLTFFWEKIEGLKFRRKLRFRTYGDGSDPFIEIKQRIDRTLQKRRVRWPLERVTEVFGPEGALLDDGAVEHPVASEVLCMCRQYDLRPTMAVSYRRRAFLGTFEPDLRITFDTRVQYHAGELDLARPFDVGRYVVDPRLAIMEVKFNHRVPIWLIGLISCFGLSVKRISKYCTAVDLDRFGGQHT